MRSSFHTCYICVTSDGNTVYFTQLLQLLLLVQLAGSHQTHPSDPSQNDGAGPAAGVQTLLTKEEVKFVVVLFCAVGDLLDLNKHRLWGINTDEPAEGLGKWLSNKMRGASTCNQSHLTPPHPPPPDPPARSYSPLSHLESYCSVLMAVLPPMVLNRAASVLMKSMWTPA